MPTEELARIFRTARHFRLSQLAWRLRYALTRRFVAPRTPAAPDRPERSPWPSDSTLPPPPPATDPSGRALLERLRSGSLTVAGYTMPFNVKQPDWRLGPRDSLRLPTVTLHYHRWLYELLAYAADGQGGSSHQSSSHQMAEQLAATALDDWLQHCGRLTRATAPLAWNSYAIATRIGWWVRLLNLAPCEQPDWSQRRDAMHRSLYQQASHLHRAIEWDLRANHLFRDAVGLAWAGRFFASRAAETWLTTARRIVSQQLDEQILSDGVHFERSPMYHIEMMHDIETASQLLGDSTIEERANAVLDRMTSAVPWMTHPDGSTMQLNDGRRCDVANELPGRSFPHAHGGRWLGDAGWAVFHSPRWFVAFDAGEIGPREQPGHGHADTLSVECSFQGRRLFVDPGNFDYDPTAQRLNERSTTAHNTIACDGHDSSEVWHIFRAGRRAKVRRAKIETYQTRLRASAEHLGFRNLPDQPIHRRSVLVDADGALEIVDHVRREGEGSSEHDLQGGWLLEPGWRAELIPAGWRLRHEGLPTLEIQLQGQGGLQRSIEPAQVATSYHQQASTVRLVWRCRGYLPLRIAMTVSPQHESPREAASAINAPRFLRSKPGDRPHCQGRQERKEERKPLC